LEISIEQAIDVGQSTFEAHKKDALQMTFAEACYTPVNELFTTDKILLEGGDSVKGWVTLEDTGNAKHISLWEEDSDNVVNTDSEIEVKWTHATTNLSYSRIELGMTMDDNLRTYRYLDGKRKNMFRELAELLQDAIFQAPTSSSDKKNPHGLPSWLSFGTADNTGGFTGYYGHYNDGSATTYAVGGITSSSTVKPRWASYYADHQGNLGDNLLVLLDRATRKTHFVPMIVPEKVAEQTTWGNFRYFTNDKIIGNLNSLLLKSDDRVGPDLGKYHGLTVYKGIPFIYVEKLDTANTSTYDTDPLFGVNMDQFHVYVLASNNFVIGKPVPRDQYHNILKVHVDVSYAFMMDNRQRGGFLINQNTQ